MNLLTPRLMLWCFFILVGMTNVLPLFGIVTTL